ncbi:hypothetical protein JYT87_00835 [Nitrospira defluvii]|nr:hypothetical protein [Nitrospira defluvii]
MTEVNFDPRFIEVFYELEAFKRYLDLLKEQWPIIIKQQEEKAKKEQSEYDYDDGDWHRVSQEFNELKEDILPRFFVGPILITLWAIFESALGEIAKEVSEQQNQKIKMNDLKGDLFVRTKKYFNYVLKFPLQNSDEKWWSRLDRFKVLRNAMAHSNGRLENIKDQKDIEKIKIWDKDRSIGVSIRDENLIISENFVRDTYSEIYEMLDFMTKRVKKDYPTPRHW